MRTALVASVSCNRLFMCSILRVAVFNFWVSSFVVGSTFHTNGSKEKRQTEIKIKRDYCRSSFCFALLCDEGQTGQNNIKFCRSSFKRTLFGVRGCEQMLKRGKGCDGGRQVLGLGGFHTLAFFPGHGLEVTEGHNSQSRLALIGVSPLRVWWQRLAPRLDQHWSRNEKCNFSNLDTPQSWRQTQRNWFSLFFN